MARRKKGELPPIHRTDLLPHGMNAGKVAAPADHEENHEPGGADHPSGLDGRD